MPQRVLRCGKAFVPGNVFTLTSRFARFARVRKRNAVNGALTSGPFSGKPHLPARAFGIRTSAIQPLTILVCWGGVSPGRGRLLAHTEARAVPMRCHSSVTRQRAVNTGVRGRRLEAFQRNSPIGAAFFVFHIPPLPQRLTSSPSA